MCIQFVVLFLYFGSSLDKTARILSRYIEFDAFEKLNSLQLQGGWVPLQDVNAHPMKLPWPSDTVLLCIARSLSLKIFITLARTCVRYHMWKLACLLQGLICVSTNPWRSWMGFTSLGCWSLSPIVALVIYANMLRWSIKPWNLKISQSM